MHTVAAPTEAKCSASTSIFGFTSETKDCCEDGNDDDGMEDDLNIENGRIFVPEDLEVWSNLKMRFPY